MQTFLPYPSFADSAAVLDRQRLGKQRVENLQIMKTLLTGTGWVHHPAVKMWAGYENCLLQYQIQICKEWTSRGYQDTCCQKTIDLYLEYKKGSPWAEPPWLGDPDFHLSHQSNLIRKDRAHYQPLFPGVPGYLPYLWPTEGEHMKREGQVTIRDARIIFRNFAGREGQYNREGDRNFTVVLPEDVAKEMGEDGWNVKVKPPREEGEPSEYHIQVSVSYKGRPPAVTMISSKNRNVLGEDMIEILDSVDIAKADIILNPYAWVVNGNSGIKAYLQTAYITIDEDELQREYAEMED